MYTKNYFRKGDAVIGFSFTGQKIIGNFVRALPSFGVLILGFPENQPGEIKEYKCARLSLERVKPKIRHKIKGVHSRFVFGDPCIGLTKDGKTIIGTYANAGPKPYVFIRGVVSTNGLVSPFDPLQTFKVLRATLRMQA